MDVEMPVRNGIEAGHEIRERWPETSVVIVTGSAAGRQLGREGFADVVEKSAADLQSDLLHALRRASRTPRDTE